VKTETLLRNYSRALLDERDKKLNPTKARALYRWFKRWWQSLSTLQRGDVMPILEAGGKLRAEYLIGAPMFTGILKGQVKGRSDSPVPASRKARRAADDKRRRKHAGKSKRASNGLLSAS